MMVARIAGYTYDSVDVDSCGLQGINRKMKLAGRNWRFMPFPKAFRMPISTSRDFDENPGWRAQCYSSSFEAYESQGSY
jgi:hypothetical protein